MNAPKQSNRELWYAYRTTYEAFSRQMERLQALLASDNRNSAQIESTLLEVEKARLAHNNARDHLARTLLENGRADAYAHDVRDDSREDHVRHTAHLLWEFAGRPQGTTEDDWYRAERLVLKAEKSSLPAGVASVH